MLNNDFFLLFVLAHLVGDYVLQTNKIARMKSEGFKGVALHTLIVGLVQITLLSGCGVRGLLAGAIGTLIHYGIDCLKFILGRYLKKMELLLYLFDQGLHFLVMLLITVILAPRTGEISNYIPYIRLLVGLILIIWTAAVTAKTVIRNFFADIRGGSFFVRQERWSDALTGGILFGSIFIHPLLGMFVILSGTYVYYRMQNKAYRYNCKVALVKYATLVLFVVLAMWIGYMP